MRILAMSDLHLECGIPVFVPGHHLYDLVILAGDIYAPGVRGVRWAQMESTFGGRPVILVPGNHEYYGSVLSAQLKEMHAAAAGSNVHVLDRQTLVVGGIRFLGATLWTDFSLPMQIGEDRDANIGKALATANQSLNDFQCIEVVAQAVRSYRPREFKRLLRAEDTLSMHWLDRDWLRRELKKPFEGHTIVTTHHAPSAESIAARYAGDALTPAFVSHLPDEFFEVPTLWMHGHTHTPADYLRGRCRVVSNPRGYRTKDGGFENPRFDAGMIIELPLDAWGQAGEVGA